MASHCSKDKVQNPYHGLQDIRYDLFQKLLIEILYTKYTMVVIVRYINPTRDLHFSWFIHPPDKYGMLTTLEYGSSICIFSLNLQKIIGNMFYSYIFIYGKEWGSEKLRNSLKVKQLWNNGGRNKIFKLFFKTHSPIFPKTSIVVV